MLLCYVSSFILFFLHCPLSGPVLTSISLLIIPCMIVYVTNKQEPWTLNLEPYWEKTGCSMWNQTLSTPIWPKWHAHNTPWIFDCEIGSRIGLLLSKHRIVNYSGSPLLFLLYFWSNKCSLSEHKRLLSKTFKKNTPPPPIVTFLDFVSLFIDRKIEKEQELMCRRKGKESVKECDSHSHRSQVHQCDYLR